MARRYSLFAPLILGAGLTACGEPPPAPSEPRAVRVQAVRVAPLERDLVYPGVVVPRFEADVGFRVGGKIARRALDVGATVAPDTVVATLDPADLELAVRQARSRLVSAEAEYRQTRAELSRQETLVQRAVVARAAYDRALAADATAAARVQEMRSALAVAENAAAYGTLHAGAHGVVTAIQAEAGQVVSAGQTVVRIARTDELEVRVDVPEGRVRDALSAAAIRVRLWADDAAEFGATVREVAPSADPVTRTYAIRLAMAEASARMRFGMTAEARFSLPAGEPMVELPRSALFQDAGRPAVWVMAPGADRVSLRPVTVFAFGASTVTITEGLAEGERVITAGVHKLDPDLAVRAVDNAVREARR